MEGALQSGVAQQRNVEYVVQVHEDLVPETKVKANQKRTRENYSPILGFEYSKIHYLSLVMENARSRFCNFFDTSIYS